MKAEAAKIIHLGDPTNDGATAIGFEQPYAVVARLEGTSSLLFHRYSVDAVAEKAKARKGSKAKKEDDLESYVYRTPEGLLAIPGRYVRGAVVNAARFKQDPRSPRKSAMEMVKAGVVALTELCSLGRAEWEFVDRRRVLVQRNAITRMRPGVAAGWQIAVELQVLLPEYIDPAFLHDLVTMAGRLIGLGDDRPTFGRYQVIGWDVLTA
jgi:hypothetical protein